MRLFAKLHKFRNLLFLSPSTTKINQRWVFFSSRFHQLAKLEYFHSRVKQNKMKLILCLTRFANIDVKTTHD